MHACSWYWGIEVLGCRTLRLASQSSAGLRMQPYPRSPDLNWPGHLHGTGCLSARAMDTGFPTVAWRLCLGLGFGCVRFRLRPATLAWGVGVCVRLCVCSPCTQPLLARVRGVGVCVWARVLASPCNSWLGCWAVCVLRLHPATPGTVAGCGCVCLGSGFGCAPPLLAGVLGCVRAPLAPSHSWHGCATWVCVFGLGFRLRPATPGWGVGLCACSACTQPLLARVRGVGVCVWAPVSAAPRHSWLGCWAVWVLRLHPATPGTGARCGCVCLGSGFGCALPLLAGMLGCVCARVHAPLAWHLFVCRGSLRVVRALWVCGTRRPSLLGNCPCAFIVAGGVPLWRASWPSVVRRASSGLVALNAPVGFPVAVVPFPSPGACAHGFTGRLRGARGGRPRTGLSMPAAGPRRVGGAGLALRRTSSGPRDGIVPGGSLWHWSCAACAAVVGVCGPGH